jgi:hypothetical protein
MIGIIRKNAGGASSNEQLSPGSVTPGGKSVELDQRAAIYKSPTKLNGGLETAAP